MNLITCKCIGCERVYRSLKKDPKRFCSKECDYFYYMSRKHTKDYQAFLDRIRKPRMLPRRGGANV